MKYVLYESIFDLYQYPVLCREEEAEIIPLVRLVPVTGAHHDEAVALLKRCLVSLQMLPGADD